MIALAASWGMAVAMVGAAVRLTLGPSLHDRILAVNFMIFCAAGLCAAASVSADRPAWLDAAFALLMAAVVVNVGFLKFVRAGTFQAPLTQARGGS